MPLYGLVGDYGLLLGSFANGLDLRESFPKGMANILSPTQQKYQNERRKNFVVANANKREKNQTHFVVPSSKPWSLFLSSASLSSNNRSPSASISSCSSLVENMPESEFLSFSDLRDHLFLSIGGNEADDHVFFPLWARFSMESQREAHPKCVMSIGLKMPRDRVGEDCSDRLYAKEAFRDRSSWSCRAKMVSAKCRARTLSSRILSWTDNGRRIRRPGWEILAPDSKVPKRTSVPREASEPDRRRRKIRRL